MSSDDNTNLVADERALNQNLMSLLTARNNAKKERNHHGGVTEETHAEFESEIEIMYEELLTYSDHDAVEELWQGYSLDQIPHLCARPVEPDNSTTTGHFGFQSSNDETQIERAPIEYLFTWTRAFNQILNELGLKVPVKHDIDSNDVSRDDLAALLEQRGQTEALDNANVD